MSKEARQLDRQLREQGWELVRSHNHLIYRHRNGAQLVTASTPSDCRAVRNCLAQARRLTAA